MGLSGAKAAVRVGVRAGVVVAVGVENARVRGVRIVTAGVEQALYPFPQKFIFFLCFLSIRPTCGQSLWSFLSKFYIF